jgi:hypothetical protein
MKHSFSSHDHAIATVHVLPMQALRSRHVSADIKASRRARISSPPVEPPVLVLWLNQVNRWVCGDHVDVPIIQLVPKILHLQYLAKSQSTPRCQSLITARSDHPPVLRRPGPQLKSTKLASSSAVSCSFKIHRKNNYWSGGSKINKKVIEIEGQVEGHSWKGDLKWRGRKL